MARIIRAAGHPAWLITGFLLHVVGVSVAVVSLIMYPDWATIAGIALGLGGSMTVIASEVQP